VEFFRGNALISNEGASSRGKSLTNARTTPVEIIESYYVAIFFKTCMHARR